MAFPWRRTSGKLGASPALSWRISSATFLRVDLFVTVASLRRYRGVRDLIRPGDRLWTVLVQLIAYSADALMVVVVLGITAQLASEFYLIALYANLALAALLFVAFSASKFVPSEESVARRRRQHRARGILCLTEPPRPS
jgi:hypothetical protein